MIDIDLLPPEYAPKKLVSLPNIIAIAIFFLISSSLLLASISPWDQLPYRGLLNAVEGYSERVEHVDEDISKYKQKAETIHRLRARIRGLKPRLSLAEQLLKGRATWSDKLVELYRCLPPDGVWINGLSIAAQEVKPTARQRLPQGTPQDTETGPIVVQISGNVISVNEMSRFVANLEDSNIFGDVVLESVTKRASLTDSDSLMSFKLTVQILSPGEG